jgi:hypothetical protein
MYGPEDHPLAQAYERELNRVAVGQAPQMASFRGAGSRMRSPHEVAAERINRDRRELAREARLNALRAPVAPAEWAF